MISWDIDHYLNRIVPASRLDRLPRWISHFLGYRQHARKPLPEYLIWLWSAIGAFLGIILIEGIYKSSRLFEDKHAPLIIGSFGATAILIYNAIESPLSQPRNVFFGHFLCALISIGITKLFLHLGEQRYEDVRWLVGGLCVAVSSALMGMTKTVHPPAGATALLAAVDPSVRQLGWFLLPVIIISCILCLSVALIVNNIQRRYPVFWWTAVDLKNPQNNKIEREEQGIDSKVIKISAMEIDIPENFMLAEEERGMLRILQRRLDLRQNDGDGSLTSVNSASECSEKDDINT